MSDLIEFALVRDSLCFFYNDVLCLQGGHIVNADDAGELLNCILRGEGELELLVESLSKQGLLNNAQEFLGLLRKFASNPQCLFHICKFESIVMPDIIFMDFCDSSSRIESKSIVKSLRKYCRVLWVSSDQQFNGDFNDQVSCSSTRLFEPFESPFQYFQWLRSLIVYYRNSLLVLCGQQAMIIFGDLCRTNKTLSFIDSSEVNKFCFFQTSDNIVNEKISLNVIKDLFYALRTLERESEIYRLSCSLSTSCAKLIKYALVNSNNLCIKSVKEMKGIRNFMNRINKSVYEVPKLEDQIQVILDLRNVKH